VRASRPSSRTTIQRPVAQELAAWDGATAGLFERRKLKFEAEGLHH